MQDENCFDLEFFLKLFLKLFLKPFWNRFEYTDTSQSPVDIYEGMTVQTL